MSLAESLAGKSTLPLRGNVVLAMMKAFAMRPPQGDDRWPTCSIGVAHNSVVATDGSSAIIIGEPAAEHEATDYKETVIACTRSELYGEPVDLDTLDRNVEEGTGEVVIMPNVSGTIARELGEMERVVALDPRALARIAAVAIKAGASTVEILQPLKADVKRLGFTLAFAPASDHINLFSEWTGMITASGVVVVDEGRKAERVKPEPAAADTTGEDVSEADADAKPKRKGKKAAVAAELPPEEPVKLTVVEAVNLNDQEERGGIKLPPLSILGDYPMTTGTGEHSDAILAALSNFNIPARVERVDCGPCVSMYEIAIPPKMSVKKVAGLQDDLQAQLGVTSIRIQAPIPGKKTIGIELPNAVPQTVGLRHVLAQKDFVYGPLLTFGVGLDVAGNPVYADLTKMPHLLVAGATNSGKSIGVAAIISSLLLRNTPKELRMVMIDPKRVELTLFDKIPHLMCPVVTDMKEAPGVLRAIWREMDIRYSKLEEEGRRNIESYNEGRDELDRLPYIVVVIDELADLMIQARDEVETSIVRLTQMARAVGIHLVIATQRPSVDVVTGLIKANVPSRIGFACSSMVDSKVILDQPGAEKLLGRGDMLYSPIGAPPRRVQGAYVSEAEVAQIVNYWKSQSLPSYELKLHMPPDEDEDLKADPNYADMVEWTRGQKQLSTSMLQRKFAIGFSRAKAVIDAMEKEGIVGPQDGPRPREVIG